MNATRIVHSDVLVLYVLIIHREAKFCSPFLLFRYECPAGCLDSKAKVIGSVHYEMQSSICRAAIHYGIIDNDGGWVDITRQGRKHYFIKSNRNGVQTIGKYQSANSFTVSKVTVQAVTCETTVEQLCPFHKPASHCPRVYCPRNCMQANPHYARVIGTRIYSDVSTLIYAALSIYLYACTRV
ncbi:hypothetical protein J1605_001807 [Eschrichtius robustus]|uniref:LCCL domain-containing protein n=1 Tax=Eschrichtius robustus TaxID=9764 RepID=A0AB34HVX8_ESCRO|nr:hypothetical protein J1605_001807 [Eschrichtius robustus]